MQNEQMADEEIAWRNAIVEAGQKFSQRMEEAFVQEIAKCDALLPKGNQDANANLIACFMDYLIGTTVAMVVSFVGKGDDSKALQNLFELHVKDKFERIREIKREAERDRHSN